ncbi:MAG: NHLP leader peptide family natural product precursor [Okeania sp. SIO3B5]|uniref:NHLP leader peptide family RiPP precursor n=1 Tax=Okeania sp. SIO3B5 TaxID=2607811 RepID=UPI0014019372|nr:NHLP leader peptide family RiPP precursor [Okeania sp. SIO3B5]NEO57731.1 NHLP leader peptide family natural product precursor [Okeania sp. SIO3B5]
MKENPTVLTPIYEKAWREPQFKQSLLDNPLATLQQEGMTFPEGLNFIAVAETDTHRYIVIPVEGSPDKGAETLLEYVRSKAMQDGEFKQSLLANPKAVLSEELGQAIPENVQVTVVEETAETRYLVIPPQPDMQYVIERAWQDPIFKQNLLSEPKSTLAQIGIIADENQEIKVKEETDFQRYILLEDEMKTQEGEENDPLSALKVKASQDNTFKQKLIQSPKQTIEEELGFTLPSWVEVEVLEETSNTSYFIIPHLPSEEEVESEEIMAVTGGWRRRGRWIRARGSWGVRFGRGGGFNYTSRSGTRRWSIGW